MDRSVQTTTTKRGKLHEGPPYRRRHNRCPGDHRGFPKDDQDPQREKRGIPYVHSKGRQAPESSNQRTPRRNNQPGDHERSRRAGLRPRLRSNKDKPQDQARDTAGSRPGPPRTDGNPGSETMLFPCRQSREAVTEAAGHPVPPLPKIRPRIKPMHGAAQVRQVSRKPQHLGVQKEARRARKMRELPGTPPGKLQGMPEIPEANIQRREPGSEDTTRKTAGGENPPARQSDTGLELRAGSRRGEAKQQAERAQHPASRAAAWDWSQRRACSPNFSRF